MHFGEVAEDPAAIFCESVNRIFIFLDHFHHDVDHICLDQVISEFRTFTCQVAQTRNSVVQNEQFFCVKKFHKDAKTVVLIDLLASFTWFSWDIDQNYKCFHLKMRMMLPFEQFDEGRNNTWICYLFLRNIERYVIGKEISQSDNSFEGVKLIKGFNLLYKFIDIVKTKFSVLHSFVNFLVLLNGGDEGRIGYAPGLIVLLNHLGALRHISFSIKLHLSFHFPDVKVVLVDDLSVRIFEGCVLHYIT